MVLWKRGRDVSRRFRLCEVLHNAVDHGPHVHLRGLTLVHIKRILLFEVGCAIISSSIAACPSKLTSCRKLMSERNSIEQAAAGRGLNSVDAAREHGVYQFDLFFRNGLQKLQAQRPRLRAESVVADS